MKASELGINKQVIKLMAQQEKLIAKHNLPVLTALRHPDVRNLQTKINALLLKREGESWKS